MSQSRGGLFWELRLDAQIFSQQVSFTRRYIEIKN